MESSPVILATLSRSEIWPGRRLSYGYWVAMWRTAVSAWVATKDVQSSTA